MSFNAWGRGKTTKRTLLYLSLALFVAIVGRTAALPGAATAQDTRDKAGGFYVSLSGLPVMPENSDTTSDEVDEPLVSGRLDGNLGLKTGPGMLGAAGYDFGNGLRTEIEFGYRKIYIDGFDGEFNGDVDGVPVTNLPIRDPIDVGPFRGGKLRGDIETKSFMTNAYYAYPKYQLKPYIGAGIGVAFHSAERTLDRVAAGDIVIIEKSTEEYDDTSFAYQAMVGVVFGFTKNIEARLGYRFMGTPDLELDYTDISYSTHGIELGILYRFQSLLGFAGRHQSDRK